MARNFLRNLARHHRRAGSRATTGFERTGSEKLLERAERHMVAAVSLQTAANNTEASRAIRDMLLGSALPCLDTGSEASR